LADEPVRKLIRQFDTSDAHTGNRYSRW